MDAVRRIAAVTVLAVTALMAGRPASAQTETRDVVELQAYAIRDRFVAEMRKCGVVPTFEPGVVVETHPSVVAYFQVGRSPGRL